MTSKFEIVSVKMIGQYEYKSPIDNDICNICKYNINGLSIYHQHNCVFHIIEGQCGHSYHSECLDKLKIKNCPTCCQTWTIKKIIKI